MQGLNRFNASFWMVMRVEGNLGERSRRRPSRERLDDVPFRSAALEVVSSVNWKVDEAHIKGNSSRSSRSSSMRLTSRPNACTIVSSRLPTSLSSTEARDGRAADIAYPETFCRLDRRKEVDATSGSRTRSVRTAAARWSRSHTTLKNE